MITDLNRLHQVILGEDTGRQCGHTFSKCHELLGVLETTDDKPIVCILTSLEDLPRFLLLMLLDVFRDHQFYPNPDCDNYFRYNQIEHCMYVTVKELYENRRVKFFAFTSKDNTVPLKYYSLLKGSEAYIIDFTEGQIR